MSDVSRLLDAAAAGDRRAIADLLPLVYTELRRLAAAQMAREKPGHTLDPTALAHEACLHLVGPADASSSPPPGPCAASWSRPPAAGRDALARTGPDEAVLSLHDAWPAWRAPV
jgi:hypothetical protein